MRLYHLAGVFAVPLVTWFGAAPLSYAQAAYPDRPIKLIVPYPPGGPTDIVARLIAQKLTATMDQPVFVDNQSGANGNIGSSAAARATADGYTLLLGSAGPLTINPSLYPKMAFNSATDFSPISLVAQLPLVLVAGPNLKVKSVAELIALGRSKPGELTFASSGNGSTQHLAGELFKSMAHIDARHIPYKGAAAALGDVLAGRIDFMIELTPTALPQIAAGKLRPLAVTSLKRLPTLSDVPTLDESGLTDFEVISWFGIVAPAGTPRSIVGKLNDVLTQATRDAHTREIFAGQGVLPLESTAAEFESRIKSDLAKWGKVVKQANVQIN
ncbi:Bug family tripartite tricarboxylate transporter substrate binding protein [Caenimonas soli]|uniref:Bug family tripartite tricarboxylate transporter substrate binding protein n=1 Tax=Caenimonas soli TaxID=2735555 RepID=UPI0015534512|nr:tripartite tricarboxylate transporter substrate binding protein [Caenimonas soli]NPC59127.1 tripartite tricarboxylate transporter substrate binding protein [Caenimonas soli]